MASHDSNELLQFTNSLLKRGFNFNEISVQLIEKGISENQVHETIEKAKKRNLEQKRNFGFVCCGIGVGLLVSGCMLALLLFNSGTSIKFALYGLTTVGIIFTIKGLADITGWS